MTSSHVVAAAANRLDNRVSGGSFLSDDEFVVIRLGGSASLTSDPRSPAAASSKTLSFFKEQGPASSRDLDCFPVIKSQAASAEAGSTQIRRITMKKKKKDSTSEAEQSAKKDSMATIVIDSKESLKAPLIVQSDEESEQAAGGSRRRSSRCSRSSGGGISADANDSDSKNYLTLSKCDLPRSLRSSRRLSACNEHLLSGRMQQRLQMAAGGVSSAPPEPLTTDSAIKAAASCDFPKTHANVKQSTTTTSIPEKSIKVITSMTMTILFYFVSYCRASQA